jgi:hypothetical protein
MVKEINSLTDLPAYAAEFPPLFLLPQYDNHVP